MIERKLNFEQMSFGYTFGNNKYFKYMLNSNAKCEEIG